MAITGRAVALALLGLIPAALLPSGTTVGLWVLLLTVVVGVDVLLAAPRPAIRVTRSPTPPLRLHEAGKTTLHVENTGRRTARLLLRDAWQPSAGTTGERHRLVLRPGESTDLATGLAPTRRGDLVADRITVRSHGPLRVAARQGPLRAPGTLRVHPAFPSRRHLPGLLADLRGLEGRNLVRTRGQGTEFDSLREYVPGDDVRSIDWRATARHQSTVVRTWRPERDRQVVLVLDTSRTAAGRVGDTPRIDAAMDAALLLTALATRAGDRVDLVAGDRVVRAVSSGGRGAAGRSTRLHDVIETLAPLEASLLEADWTTLTASALDLTRGGSALVVLLTPLEPVPVQETLLPALTALGTRHRVVLASVQDPSLEALADPDDHADPLQSGYDAAAAETDLARRAHTADVLTGLGVTVLDRPPADLPLDLGRTYLSLKAHGLL